MQDTKNLALDPTKSFLAKVIDWSVNNRLLVLVGALLLAIYGTLAIERTPLDAIPDLSDTQVIIRTDFTGQSPQIVEDLVTYPLTSTMLGLPKTKAVRGFSMFGSSFVYIVFEDEVDQYWARSRVLEALSKVQGELPASVTPELGPDATGVGWVFQYALVDNSNSQSLADLRSLQDWFLKFELSTVAGVSEVASVGGFVKEYQVLINPNRLRAYGIPLHRLTQAIKNASMDAGGRVIEQGEAELMVRVKGYVTSIEDLKKVVVFADNGMPVTLADVAQVIEGAELRRGVAELDGKGEVVGGIVIMRSGENALNVINKVKQKLKTLQAGLPDGVEIVPVYDRAPLIKGAVSYLTSTLAKEGLMVALVIFLFLLHARSALVALITLPLGVLGAFIIMANQGITANILSLGGIAIAIGTMVDAAIVMVENASRKLANLPDDASDELRQKTIVIAAKEVGPGLFFSLLIIAVSFLPVLALTGESYRLFSPLAFTKTYVLLFATVLSITLLPVLLLWLMKGRIKKPQENPVNRFMIKHYLPILSKVFNKPKQVLILTVILLVSAVIPLWKTGAEFMPALYEGQLLYMPSTIPGISITEAKHALAQTNRLIKTIPEVSQVFGKAGRSDSATDPAPLSMIESWIELKPKSQWRKGMTIDKLTVELNERVKLAGLVNSWGYPIKIRTDMISTGIRTPVGIKIAGDDLKQIGETALNIEQAIKGVTGTRSVFAERVMGGKYLEITPNRDALARNGVDMGMFAQVVQTALGGMKLSESIQGRERYAIQLRYDRPFREKPSDVANVLVSTANGANIPLGELAQVAFVEAPPVIKSENARLNGWVFVDIAERDIASYVKEAQEVVNNNVTLPSGVSIEWTGQFKQMHQANKQLAIAIPSAIIVIFLLLMLHFGRLDRTIMVMVSLPIALVGGLWAVYLAGYYMSVAVAVGFIALGGLAVETVAIMMIYLDQQVREDMPKNAAALAQSVKQGALLRLRPVSMTIITEFAGLMPIFLFDGLGADVMRRIALPMIGGMFTTTLLTLIVTPVLYFLWEKRNYNS